jgi:hypothetical protein
VDDEAANFISEKVEVVEEGERGEEGVEEPYFIISK